MWTIKVIPENEYQGPTIIEMEPLLPLSDEPVEVRWLNSKREVDILRQYPTRTVQLIVKDLYTMERTAATLGLPFAVQNDVLRNGCESFNARSWRWRDFNNKMGQPVSRSTIVHATARSMRNGAKPPAAIRKVLVDCLLDHTSAMDADVLIALGLATKRH